MHNDVDELISRSGDERKTWRGLFLPVQTTSKCAASSPKKKEEPIKFWGRRW